LFTTLIALQLGAQFTRFTSTKSTNTDTPVIADAYLRHSSELDVTFLYVYLAAAVGVIEEELVPHLGCQQGFRV
jgi:hypothetical protein